MNLSPAQRHLARMKAQQQAEHAAQQSPHGAMLGGEHELMLAQLHAHQRILKAIQSVERKIEAKRKMLPDFAAYLDGVLQADTGVQDPLITTLLVWHLDVGDWAGGLTLGEYCLRHGLELPDQYKRNLPTMLLDEVAEAAIHGKLRGPEALGTLARIDTLTQEHDTHDQARAKLHKAIGWAAIGKTRTQDLSTEEIKHLPLDRLQIAHQHLTRAIELDPQAGVKKDVERLERRLKELHPPTAPN